MASSPKFCAPLATLDFEMHLEWKLSVKDPARYATQSKEFVAVLAHVLALCHHTAIYRRHFESFCRLAERRVDLVRKLAPGVQTGELSLCTVHINEGTGDEI
jgi:hypothetical protein